MELENLIVEAENKGLKEINKFKKVEPDFKVKLRKTEKIPGNGVALNLYVFETDKQNSNNLIFAPLTGSHSGFFQNSLETLSCFGYNVFGIDFMGHGKSEGKKGHFTMDNLIKNVSSTADFIKENYQGAIGLVGTHLGAEVGFYAALEDNRIKSVLAHNLLLNSELSMNFMLRVSKTGLGPFLMKKFFSNPVSLEKLYNHKLIFNEESTLKRFREDKLQTPAYDQNSYLSIFRYKPAKSLSNMKASIMIACGENGKLISHEYEHKVYEKLKEDGLNVEFCLFKGAGNQLVFDYPNFFAQVADNWFKKTLGI